MWYIHTLKYYTAIAKNQLLLYIAVWKYHIRKMLRERSQ